jgi:hypothetical protein
MKHFLFLDRDYVIAPKHKVVKKNNSVSKLGIAAAILYARKRVGGGAGKKSSGGGRVDLRQRAVIKFRYSKSGKAHKAQLAYITREGAGKDGFRPELYGNVEEYKENMVGTNFRVFISPENRNVDLRILTRLVMESIEKESGYRLYWVAAEHHNTDNPHAHVVINGVDKDGKKVFFQPSLISNRARDITRNICTAMLGQRSVEEIVTEKNNLLVTHKFTQMDNMILGALKGNTLDMNSIYGNKLDIYKRLGFLVSKGYASCENNKYTFDADWDKILRTVSKHNMYLDGKQYLKFTPQQNYSLYDGAEPLNGYVAKIFKKDEESYGYSAIIEALNGKAYFVPFEERPGFSQGNLVHVRAMKKSDYVEEKYHTYFDITSEDRNIYLKSKTFVPNDIKKDLEEHGFFWNRNGNQYVARNKGATFQGVQRTGYERDFENELKNNSSPLAKTLRDKRVKDKYHSVDD